MGRLAPPLPTLRPNLAFAEAGRKVIALRSREVFALCDGVDSIAEPDRVHDMRVATRRLRAGLEMFESCFPRKQRKRALVEVKKLADALGARRDCDVQIAILESLGSSAHPRERTAISALLEELRREQRKANRGLKRALARATRVRLERRLRKLT
jgi:CHAD domain-containing protein